MAANTEGMKATACNLCNVNCGIMVEIGGDDGRQFLKKVDCQSIVFLSDKADTYRLQRPDYALDHEIRISIVV